MTGETLRARSPEQVAEALRASSGLSIVFLLDDAGRVTDDALVAYDGEALALVPVGLLPKIADAFPDADTRVLRDTVATYHAERAGQRGRA